MFHRDTLRSKRTLRRKVTLALASVSILVVLLLFYNKRPCTVISSFRKPAFDTHERILLANRTTNSCADVLKGEYPTDIFDYCQRRNGAVVLHIIGVIYMFVALAVVCDVYFVPSLEVIIEKLEISEDVAGATFMAAGGSAPELFTSIIGVFLAKNNVGIGTIIGSAVFNILFVISVCALSSLTVLTLTWWPLFRDVSFYIVSLAMLIIFFMDNNIYWWEALILLCWYLAYVLFMKFNVQIEHFVKTRIMKQPETPQEIRNSVVFMRASVAPHRLSTVIASHGAVQSKSIELEDHENEQVEQGVCKWPISMGGRIKYVLLFPINGVLYLTVPNVLKKNMRKLYVLTFTNSIVWIGIFSYFMVWWANQIGSTFGIPNEVMGLTFLAAGTSIPDLIAGYIVAKKGFGDMAVSSSIGSNLFDICIGLPFPWLISWMIFGEPINTSSKGLFCSVLMLFAMLLSVLVIIGISKWRMTKALGISMLVAYGVFIAISLLLEYQIIKCIIV